jgi:hypothetical protein
MSAYFSVNCVPSLARSVGGEHAMLFVPIEVPELLGPSLGGEHEQSQHAVDHRQLRRLKRKSIVIEQLPHTFQTFHDAVDKEIKRYIDGSHLGFHY